MTTTTEISNAAAALGRKGGSAKSEAKTSAVRANGTLGGRPCYGVESSDSKRVIRFKNLTTRAAWIAESPDSRGAVASKDIDLRWITIGKCHIRTDYAHGQEVWDIAEYRG